MKEDGKGEEGGKGSHRDGNKGKGEEETEPSLLADSSKVFSTKEHDYIAI